MFRLETSNPGEVFFFDDFEGDAISSAIKRVRAEALEEAAQELERWTLALAVQDRAIVRIGANLVRKLKDQRDE